MPTSSMCLSKAAIALTVISVLCVFTEAATLLRVEDHRKTPEILDDTFTVTNLQNSTTQAQIFVQSLTTILSGFPETMVVLYTTYIFDFYIKDQPLVNETIFMYNNTVTPDQSNQLWSDPQYGWSNPSTLLPWVTICLQVIGIPGYDPTTNLEYSILKNHFDLTDTQMIALIGASHVGSQDFQSSMLVLLTVAVLDATSSENNCMILMGCTPTEFIQLQFFQGNFTKNPPFPGISGFDSVANVNQTYPVAPEISAVNTGDVYFDPNLGSQLLALPTFYQQGGALLNVQDVQEIIDNQNNPDAIVNSLNLDSTQQAQVLINYVNYVLNQFAYQDQPNQAMTQNRADIITYNMNALMSDIANLTSINLTAMGTSYSMQQQGKTCQNILQDAGISSSVITNICTNPEFTLDTAEGQAPWIAAYYAGEGSDVYTLIENVTGISDWDLQNLLEITSEFGGTIDMVITAIANSLGCTTIPCDNSFISTLQWAEAGVTRNLPREYFNQTYSSLADIFPDHFEGSYPEFPAFTSKYLGVMVSLSLDQADALLSYNVGSLNNPYEVFRFLTMNSDNDYADIQARFGLSKSLSNDMILYFDSGLPNYQ